MTADVAFTTTFRFGHCIASYANFVVSLIQTIRDGINLPKTPSPYENYIVGSTEIDDGVTYATTLRAHYYGPNTGDMVVYRS